MTTFLDLANSFSLFMMLLAIFIGIVLLIDSNQRKTKKK